MRREIEARDRKKNEITVIFIFLLLSVLGKYSVAQNPNCDANVPYFNVNMALSPQGVWTSPPVTRVGYCCGASGSDACVAFDITLNPNTAGIQIDMTGANPGGSLFYQVNCGSSFPGGTIKCISGAGPHHITLCKPGGNSNTYIITAVSKPLFPADDTLRIGCKQKLMSYGVANNSVTWHSIYPGTPGQYDNYLDSANVASPTYSALPGAPPYVEYKVCGMPIATMCGYTVQVCDTVRIYNFQPLTNLFNPSPAAFCNTGPGSGVSISATPAGGQAPYQYIWSNGTGTVGTNNSYFATTAGTYSLEIRDVLYNSATCPSITQTISVIQGTVPVVDAGPNTTTCSSSPLSNLNGSVQFAGGGIWSGGTGTFSPNNTSLNANYAPSASELAAGFVKLYLTSSVTGGGCPNKKDSVILYYSTLTATTSIVSNYNGYNISCPGLNDGAVSVNVSGGTAGYNYSWNTSPVQNTQNATGLGAGTWAVTITDVNNCSVTKSVTLVDPPPIIANAITSQTVRCFGGSNGTASVSVSGGAPVYSYTWNTTPVQNTKNVTGLGAGTWIVIVKDANNCTATSSITLVNPTPVIATAIVNQTVLCSGDHNGAASVSASGGSAGYTYSWNTSPVQTSQNATGLGSGTWSVTIKDANNCTATASVALVNPTPVSASAVVSQTILCSGDNNGAASVNASGGSPGYSYSWNTSPVQTGQNATGLSAGTWAVTIKDANNCSVTKTISLINPSPVNANAIISQTVLCTGGNDGSALVNASGGAGGYTYNWNTSPVQTTQNASGLSAGTWAVTISDANNCSITKNITLIDPSPVSASAIVSQTIHCSGGSNGAAIASASGGASGYSYTWNTNPVQTGATANGLSAGTYSVTIMDANGCSALAAVTVNPGIPFNTATSIVSNYNGQNISCNGSTDGSASVNVSGGAGAYTYTWNTVPVQNTQTATNLGAGTYVVSISDINNCLGSATVTLTEPPPLQPFALTTQTVDCNGGSTGSAAVSANGGVSGYTYVWNTNPAQTGAAAYNLTAGNYNVTVTDANGCSTMAGVAVAQPAPIDIVISNLSNYYGYNVKCNGDMTGSVDISVSGGIGAYTYQWSNGATTEDLSSVGAGAYNVVVTDANGCVNTITLPLTQPGPINATLDSLSLYNTYNVSCNGSSDGSIFVNVIGGANNYSYSWSNGSTTEDISNLTAGNYSLTITDQNGCNTSIGFTLTEPAPIAMSYASVSPACTGMHDGSINVNSNGGIAPYQYNWSNGVTSANNQNIAAGTYTVTSTDLNGCSTTEVINLPDPTILNIRNAIVDNKCFKDSTGGITSIVVGGTLPYTYQWSNGSTTKDISNIPAGTYSIVVTDAHGCHVSNTLIITQPDSLQIALSSPVLYNGHNISLYNGSDGSIGVNVAGGVNPYTFQWSNSSHTGDQYNVHAGTYQVMCADANGCRTTATITLSQPSALEMPTGFSPNGDGANDLFVVHGIEAYPSNFLTIYNRWGNIVFSKAMYNNDWDGSNYDGQALPAGTYFALLEINGKEIVLKNYVEIRRQ